MADTEGTEVMSKSRGLGMLLANIGANKNGNADAASKPVIPAAPKIAPQAPQEKMGFDLNQMSDFSGWGDISAMDQMGGGGGGSGGGGNSKPPQQKNQPARGESSTSSADKGESGQSSWRTGAGESGQPSWKADAASNRCEEVYGPPSIDSWADIKEYDDDHDQQWFDEERARLGEIYGGSFIQVKYLDSQPGRVGYFCQLCSAEMNARKSLDLHCRGMRHLKKKDQYEKGDRQLELPTNAQRDRSPRSPFRGSRDSRNNRRDRDRRSYRSPSPNYNRNDDRGFYSRNDPPRRDHFPSHPRNRNFYERRRSPDMRSGGYNQPGPMRGAVDRFDRFEPYGRRETPPPPLMSRFSEPAFRAPPSPPRISNTDANRPSALVEGMSDGPCCELLLRLSASRVKNEEDSSLAANVACFLVNSLKEYYSKTGPTTVVHLLDQIAVKFDLLKELSKD